MGKVRIKLDTSKLKDDFTFDSHWIKSQQNLDSQMGWEEIIEALMGMIEITAQEYIGEEDRTT